MARRRLPAAALVLAAALAASPAAIASGGGGTGGGGGGGTGGGGGSAACVPLTTVTSPVHTDFSTNWHIGVQATIRNCSSGNQLYHLNVSVPNSGETPFNTDTGLPPNGSVTWVASPGGSTPLQLQSGQTYTVIATLTQTNVSPAKVLSTVRSTVQIPTTPGA